MAAPIKIRSPSQRFQKLFAILEATAEFVGANVIREDYHFNWVTYILFIFIIGFFSFTIYTCYVGVVVQEDWLIMLQSISLTGTAVQGVAKLINGVLYAPKLRFLRREIDGIFEKYEREHDVYQKHLMHSLSLLKRSTVTLLVIYGLTMFGLISVPLCFRYIFNQRILILQFLIPGVDPTSHLGYIAHQIVHVICIFFGLFGNFASDTVCFVFVIHIPLIKNILKCKFDDLDVILREFPRDASKSGELLKDIFQWHQKYIHFSSMAKKSFFWVIFVQMGTASISIICVIICQFLGVMPAGPVYLFYSFVILYIYSALGNLVEISNDDVTTGIYDSLWYLLTVPEQKMILIMLRESQNTEGMSIGGVSPLSLNAALQITKTIYTVAMLINKFLN